MIGVFDSGYGGLTILQQIRNVLPEYDYLYLINGRRKDAPRLKVEVASAEFVILTDEDGNDATYIENGQEYLVCQVWYHLGKVISTENAEGIL